MSTTTGAVGTAETELTSQAVVSAVAAETGTDPLELEPLYEVFDPDALDALLGWGESGTTSEPVCVEFTYAGCGVCVTADGTVEVEALAE